MKLKGEGGSNGTFFSYDKELKGTDFAEAQNWMAKHQVLVQTT